MTEEVTVSTKKKKKATSIVRDLGILVVAMLSVSLGATLPRDEDAHTQALRLQGDDGGVCGGSAVPTNNDVWLYIQTVIRITISQPIAMQKPLQLKAVITKRLFRIFGAT